MRINPKMHICQKQQCTLLTVHSLATSGQGLQAFQYMSSSPLHTFTISPGHWQENKHQNLHKSVKPLKISVWLGIDMIMD